MDERRFDHLVKIISDVATRRDTARRLAALPLAGALALLLGDETGAGRRRRRKARHNPGKDKENRKGKRKGQGKGKPRACTPDCAGKDCGPDGCGGSCGLNNCPAGANCGTITNACGETINCGTCPADQSCGTGGTPNVCAPCVLTAECTAAIAAGRPVRCCAGSCVVGGCCRSADCAGTRVMCVGHACLACPPEWTNAECEAVNP